MPVTPGNLPGTYVVPDWHRPRPQLVLYIQVVIRHNFVLKILDHKGAVIVAGTVPQLITVEARQA